MEKLTDKEVLQKAIDIAIKSGFDNSKTCESIGYFLFMFAKHKNRRLGRSIYYQSSDNIKDAYGVIFSQDFAKALWGEENTIVGFTPSGDNLIMARWKGCLREMVLYDNPIDYLRNFIDSTEHQVKQELYLDIFPDNYCLIIERMIKFEFPNIKNLSVKRSGQLTISVDFDEGEYTKEQIQTKIKEYRDNHRKLIIK